MNAAWQIEVRLAPGVDDAVGHQVEGNLGWIGVSKGLSVKTARQFLLVGDLDRARAERLARDLLADPVTESATVHDHASWDGRRAASVTVYRKQGVMDPVESSIRRGADRLGCRLDHVRTGTTYEFTGTVDDATLARIGSGLLANGAIEDMKVGVVRIPDVRSPSAGAFGRREIPLRTANDAALEKISKDGGLSLSLEEMKAIAAHFVAEGREPTDVELETLAQTWSEHCKHKTLTGGVVYNAGRPDEMRFSNLLKETIKAATETIAHPMCLSVFHDNAGVIAFGDDDALCIKVETHNHPSAIEPYGGAGTGVGGVIRDILGTGRGAKPVANIDVFCVAPPDMAATDVPKGCMHPLRILRGVVAGVRDYGNQMGIPTVNGAVVFDDRYVGNPLVYAGTVGLMPKSAVTKEVRPGDLIVALGGRTGRDGIHGATFSSAELHAESETVDSGAVQIGNAITEKKVADVVLTARDRDLFRAITDCGAGGFSSAVGEMGAECGADVVLDAAPLKYAGLSPAEIWISEAQERMVLAVQPERLDALLALCRDEDVEAAVLGTFTDTGRLRIRHAGVLHADMDMNFLHDGVPKTAREASWEAPAAQPDPTVAPGETGTAILRLLSTPDIASKEWIIRQYDHEVQAGSVVKPLVGTRHHGPSDAAVVAPVLGARRGFALGNGIAPRHADLDPASAAEAGIDEALRNVVAVGGDPSRCAILDNFSWGNCRKPDRLGAMVRCSVACRDTAIALGTPFVSGKDSLNNEYLADGRTIVIPHTLLVTALAIVPDVADCVTMDLKAAGRSLWQIGVSKEELGGSALARLAGTLGTHAPRIDGARAKATFAALHAAIRKGLVASCHDLSEGGLAVALAEMVLAGEIGAEIDVDAAPAATGTTLTARLFGESLTRFIVEVAPGRDAEFAACFAGLDAARIGVTTEKPELVLASGGRRLASLSAKDLERAWRPSLSNILQSGISASEAH